MGLSGRKPGISKEPLTPETRRWLGVLLLAAGVFAYFSLRDGQPWSSGPGPQATVAPLVVYLYEADGQLALAARAEFEAGIGTVSVWLETASERAEYVNRETLYPGERSAAWLGDWDGRADGGELLAAAQAVSAQHRGKITAAARALRCIPAADGGEYADESAWRCSWR